MPNPNQFWFLDGLITIHVSASEGTDGISVIEHLLPFGSSPTMHLHRTEDEVFQILAGELRVVSQGRERRLKAGDFLLGPKGVPHTYRVESAGGARCLVTTAHGDFERFVRELSRPADQATLPKLAGPPTPEMIQALTATAAKHGIEIGGPPLG
jgi:quercetin dioxygenase-like cupin family protein